ncbi:MAG: PAS domain-containing protein, partial [Proteobacteria bacterium]|nr:PAS domain-containing protein [Pseudomonadota bacterium]
LVGSGLLLLSWHAELSRTTGLPTWLPIPFGIASLVISLSFWQALYPNQNVGVAEIANILLLIGAIALSFVIAGLVYLAQWARKNQLLAESSLRELVHETDARTKTDQQLKAIEDRWQFAVEGNRDGVWDWNVKDNEVYFSKCWKNMLGFDEDEISSDLNEWEKRIHPDDKDRVMADVNRHFVGEAPYYENEHRVLCKDGTYKWILDRGTVVARTEDGKPLRMIGTHTDITERKLEQEALAKNIRDLEDQKYVLDHHAIVSRTDIAGRITYVNEKFCEISGYSSEELLGQHHRFINSNFHSAEFFKQLWSTIASGDIWRGEIRNRAKDGSFYWVESTLIPLLDEKGAIQEYVGVRTDITGRKRAEEHLRRTQKLEAIGELTGGIAHDFNNLLGIILGNIKLVGRNADPGSTMQKQLDRVAKAATRGVVLTRRMLKFSQQSPEQHSPLNINEVLESMRDLISKSLTAKVKVEMSLAEDLWMVDIDEGSFEDAMINLSLNARDAMAEGGDLLFETKNMSLDRRSVRREESLNPGDYVCLEVKDTGIGMSTDILEKIFDPFFTTKDKAGGTGLGLPMVYGFIQRCKGHISVFSEPGKGSTFKIYLPRTENGKSLFKKSKLEQGAAATSLPRGTETILIVDDEKDLTLIAEEILQELGYTAICAGAGDEALRILAENQNIKLLISDIVMPGMSGVALADATTMLYPDIKIILTSGYIGPGESQANARAYGAVLVKPYDDSELARRVRESLDGA